jgi:hypothetical protein
MKITSLTLPLLSLLSSLAALMLTQPALALAYTINIAAVGQTVMLENSSGGLRAATEGEVIVSVGYLNGTPQQIAE